MALNFNINEFPGYTGWREAEANADFAATGGAGKGVPGGASSSGGGNFNQVAAPDVANLRKEVFDNPQFRAYYEELAKQAQGDFNLAVKMMSDDYRQGTRQAKEDLAFTQRYGRNELDNTLASLGVTFQKEDEALVDNLNKRGMAVYQNNPDGTPNVVTPGEFKPNYDMTNYSFNTGVAPVANLANLGRGGVEMSRNKQEQGLRAEAQMRAQMKPLEQAGIAFKQYTNPATGYDPNNPAAFKGDRSQLGTAELNTINKYNTAEQGYRDKTQNLANQKIQSVNTIAGALAATGAKSLGQDLTNQLNREYQTSFIQKGNIV